MSGRPHLEGGTSSDQTIPDLLARRDPASAPDDRRLVEAALRWIAVTSEPGPLVCGWAQYAVAASQRMCPPDDPLRQRAALADAAVRAGLLPSSDGSSWTVAAVLALITNTGRAPADLEYVRDGLHAYASVHARGQCAIAHAGLRHLRMPAEPHDGPRPALLATLVVSIALLSACDRDDLGARLLDVHAAQLEPAGTPGRELFAALALDLSDRIRESHRGVCTHARNEPFDRHRFSALLHGERPTWHRSPAPPDGHPAPVSLADKATAASADDLFLSFDGILYGLLSHAETLRNRRLLQARTTSSNVWFVCDTCRIALRLGASVVRADLPDTLSAPILTAGRRAWQDDGVSRAMWRLLSDHCGHEFRVLTQVSPAWRKYAVTPTDLISQPDTDPAPDITLDDYLTGWPGQPSLTRFDGAAPAPPADPVEGEVSLVCLACRLEVVLGYVSASSGGAISIGGQLAANQPTATIAVFRMLTEHTGHDLMIFTDTSPWDLFTASGEWLTTVGVGVGDLPPQIGDITHRQYIDGWPDAPTRRYYRGTDPLDSSLAPTPPPGSAP